MRKIDWPSLLSQHRVDWIDVGPNVKRGEINIKCPFCGTDDPSYHMGISPETGWWACWRNPRHRGKDPVRLATRLFGLPLARAAALLDSEAELYDADEWSGVATRLENRRQGTQRTREIALPAESKPLPSTAAEARPFVEYIRTRGFDSPEAVCERYSLRYCLHGEFANRIVIPIEFQGSVVAWTSRAIDRSPIRYRDSSLSESVMPPKMTVFNHDRAAQGGTALVVVEGPLDAMKLDFYGHDFGVTAVALYTASATAEQTYLIADLAMRFDAVFCMMDAADSLDVVDSHRMADVLSSTRRVFPTPPPFGFKDAGDLPPAVAARTARHLAHLAHGLKQNDTIRPGV